jgi:tRNA(adenine34) deaminase
MDNRHEIFMQVALQQARRALAIREVPVGAVIVNAEGIILARGHNQTISACDPTAHAEIVALRLAAAGIGNYRLLSTTLYATVEPCVMCMGALVHARLTRVVYGAPDPKWGAAGSLYDFSTDSRFNHHVEVQGGILGAECRELMFNFFKEKREQR